MRSPRLTDQETEPDRTDEDQEEDDLAPRVEGHAGTMPRGADPG
jgi:hypothetical protein